ncbi:XRE family transcriptional regulator [Candidatus Viadribacter manganicus]|uniref:XRE family transcriptional regulator n=2 Tax=Candidatus Viadribacter manganicus TaxID=1759059 RepID=A0A1B1AFL3_9PROT|nr:XRE family transcriptional regulator [Candidatus Viadribacter manganicus]
MPMLTSAQLRAARALLGIDQRTLADWAGVSLPTIQRMEASDGYVRGVVDTLTKVVTALELAGVELIGENSVSSGGGRGVRLREPATPLSRDPKMRASDTSAKRKGSQLPA